MSARLGVITSGFPYTVKEAFLAAELGELAKQLDVVVYPVMPKLRAAHAQTDAQLVHMPVASLAVIADAIRELVRQPGDVARAFRAVACRGSWRARCKNAAVFCKALAVARDMRRRGVDHIHAYWASTPATVAYVAALINHVPWSFTAHRWDIYEDNVLAEKVHHARFVRAVSRRARVAILERVRAAALTVRVLHLGVSEAATCREPRAQRPFTLICAANLEPVKGHFFLIEALRRVAARKIDMRCVLAGDGSKRRALDSAIGAAGLSEYVTLAGFVPHDVLLDQLASGSYDAAVLASIEQPGGLHEGIPVFLMEAMAAQVPCIATRTGGIEELLGEGAGVLVEQKDPSALAAAIALLARDERLCADLGRTASRRIAENFSASVQARQLLGWIQGNDEDTAWRARNKTGALHSA